MVPVVQTGLFSFIGYKIKHQTNNDGRCHGLGRTVLVRFYDPAAGFFFRVSVNSEKPTNMVTVISLFGFGTLIRPGSLELFVTIRKVGSFNDDVTIVHGDSLDRLGALDSNGSLTISGTLVLGGSLTISVALVLVGLIYGVFS